MKRALLVAAGVLLPFSVLVAVGFSTAPPPQPRADEAPARAQERTHPPPATQNQSQTNENQPSTVPVPLRALMPELNQCFRDHPRDAHPVRVTLTPTAAGTFEGVQVEEQNPYLQACLVDVFAEGRWNPGGAEALDPIDYTFSFDASKD